MVTSSNSMHSVVPTQKSPSMIYNPLSLCRNGLDAKLSLCEDFDIEVRYEETDGTLDLSSPESKDTKVVSGSAAAEASASEPKIATIERREQKFSAMKFTPVSPSTTFNRRLLEASISKPGKDEGSPAKNPTNSKIKRNSPAQRKNAAFVARPVETEAERDLFNQLLHQYQSASPDMRLQDVDWVNFALQFNKAVDGQSQEFLLGAPILKESELLHYKTAQFLQQHSSTKAKATAARNAMTATLEKHNSAPWGQGYVPPQSSDRIGNSTADTTKSNTENNDAGRETSDQPNDCERLQPNSIAAAMARYKEKRERKDLKYGKAFRPILKRPDGSFVEEPPNERGGKGTQKKRGQSKEPQTQWRVCCTVDHANYKYWLAS